MSSLKNDAFRALENHTYLLHVHIICTFASFQMFLDPLGQVVGQSKSKTLLLQSCTAESQVSQLQKLGCMLGVADWTNSIQARCRPSHASLEEVDPEIADEFFRDDPEVLIWHQKFKIFSWELIEYILIDNNMLAEPQNLTRGE